MTRRIRGALLVAATAAVTACGAPAPVGAAFDARHPGTSPAWERQPYGWEAVVGDGPGYEVEFDPDGRWLETEYELPDGLIFPPAVRDAVARDAAGRPVGKWEVEATPAGTFYEIEVGELEYYYGADGRPAGNENEDA